MQLLLEIALAFGEVPFARRARGFLLRGVEFGIARLELCLEPRDFAVQGSARAVRCVARRARNADEGVDAFPLATDKPPRPPRLRLSAVAETHSPRVRVLAVDVRRGTTRGDVRRANELTLRGERVVIVGKRSGGDWLRRAFAGAFAPIVFAPIVFVPIVFESRPG